MFQVLPRREVRLEQRFTKKVISHLKTSFSDHRNKNLNNMGGRENGLGTNLLKNFERVAEK